MEARALGGTKQVKCHGREVERGLREISPLPLHHLCQESGFVSTN